MTTEERIDIMIEKGKKKRRKSQKAHEGTIPSYWNGYIAFGEQLKVSIDTEYEFHKWIQKLRKTARMQLL